MKKIFIGLTILVCVAQLHGAGSTPLKNVKISGTSFITGGTFTIQTGVTVTYNSGSTLDASAATLTLAANQIAWTKVNKSGSSLADLATRSASDLSSGTLPDARFPSTLPAVNGSNLTNLTGANIIWADGVRNTFNPNGTNAGVNVGAQAGDPSSLTNGDLWYNSSGNALKARINGSTVSLGSGGGATNFTDLADVPSSYTGGAGKVVAVKGTEDGLEFVTAASGGGVTVLAGDQVLTYVSDGDANGVFTYLGKLGNGGTWQNPHTNGDIIVAGSNVAGGTVADIVNHDASNTFDNNGFSGGPWYTFDLKTGRSLVCNKASFRERSSTGASTGFDLEGSNDGSSWTPLVTGVTTPETSSTWTTFVVPGSTGYRYFRIIRTGSSDYFTIGEFELYGTLTVGATVAGEEIALFESSSVIKPGPKLLTNTATLNFGSTAAGASSDLTITVTGAALTDPVVLGVPNASVVANSNFSAWVSATDTVKVRFDNSDLTTAGDPASGTFRVTVLHYP